MIAVLFCACVLLLALGVPVAFSLGGATLAAILYGHLPLIALPKYLFSGIDVFALMAVPFFLLVGELMTSADVVIRIARLSQALVGHIRGGLAQVVTVFSMFFADMSGSTSADISSLTLWS